MDTQMKIRFEIKHKIDEASSLLCQKPLESPVTELSFRFCVSTLNTPTSCKSNASSTLIEMNDNCEKDSNEVEEKIDQNTKTIEEEDEGLISNTFTINSAGISPATQRREQQARGIRGRLNMAPQIVNFDIKCDSPGKENALGEEDISFYASHSPAASPRQCHTTSPSIYAIDKNAMHCNSQDSTSMDSGYSGLHHPESNNILSNSSSTSAFTFLKPKRPSESGFISTSPPSQHTPSKYTLTSNGSSRMGNGFKIFNSLSSGSMESCDDEFMELMEMENMDEDTQMPSDLKSLICKDIKSSSRTPENKRPSSFARKCLNMDSINTSGKALFGSPQTPKSSTITSLITTPERQCLGTISENITPFRGQTGGFKRPEPPSANQSPVQNKRLKCENETITSSQILKFSQSPQIPSAQFQQAKRPIFRKSVSMNDAAIMSALSRSTSEPNLIGDCSLPFCLPLIEGRHTDLKSITASTLRQLLLGEFNDRVASYKIIDCRYPYEYEGGHIKGAVNLYTQEQIIEELVKIKTETPKITEGDQKRHILVFHCEFSSERGPKLSRFLRNHDRTKNENAYPALHYPEIYLLHNGYKEFYETCSDLCTPESYRPMLDVNYSDEYRHFRAKSKSWAGSGPGTVRLTKSRSRLVL